MIVDTAQALANAADNTAENTAKSMGDRVSNPNASNITPTLDPKAFVQQSSDINNAAFNAAGIPDAMAKQQASGQAAQNALGFVADKYKQDELAKYPLEDMANERNRLMTAKFRILPDVLARTDITDYKAKINLANQLMGVYDNDIGAIDAQRSAIEKKATDAAQLKVGELQSQAAILDKQFERDKADLQSRIDLYKTGEGSLQDILKTAVTMDNNNANREANSANPFLGFGSVDQAQPQSQAAPTFNEFVQQKELQAAQNPQATSFDTSPKAMEQYHQEYSTNYGDEQQATMQTPSLQKLNQDYLLARSQLNTKQEIQTFDASVNQAVASKNYDLANHIIDGAKKPLPDKTLSTFGDAIQLKEDITSLLDLYDKAASQIGPVAGTLSKANPYNEDIKVLQAKVSQAVVSLSHSLYGQTLRGPEAQKLTQTLGDPSFPIGAAEQIIKNTLSTLDGSLRKQVQAWQPYYQTLDIAQMLGDPPNANAPRFQKSANSDSLDLYLHSQGL